MLEDLAQQLMDKAAGPYRLFTASNLRPEGKRRDSLGNKVVPFLNKWDYLGQNVPTKEGDPIKVKDMLLKEIIEAKQAETAQIVTGVVPPEA